MNVLRLLSRWFVPGHVSEAVKEACKDCSPRLKHNIKWIIKAMRLNFPNEYEAFRERYDPTGENFDHIEAAVIDS